MKKFKLLEYIFDFISKYWRGVLLFVLLVFFIGRYIFSRRQSLSGFVRVDVDVAKSTISNGEAESLAGVLFLAMKDFGTIESEIDRVFGVINGNVDNLRLVYNAFGIKNYGMFGEASILDGTPSSLYMWLKNETEEDITGWGHKNSKRWLDWKNLFDKAGIRG